MGRMGLAALSSIAVVLAGAGMADARDVTLTAGKLNEVLHPAARISGVVVAGVIGGGDAAAAAEAPVLGALVPRDWAGADLCIDVLSADGLYESRNVYAVASDWAGGMARIPYPTGYRDQLASYGPDELAVLTRPGACDPGAAEVPVTATIWNAAPAAQPDEVRILLNSFRADEVYLFVGAGLDAPVAPWAPLEGPLRTGFDMVCPVPLSGTQGSTVEIEVNRVTGGALAEPYFLTLRTAP